MGSNYPFRGGKDMVWEGGVRGTAFVYSQLIKERGRVCRDLIDVSDWVPTLYYLAGGDSSLLYPNIDGKNVWETISRGDKSPRDEVLHAIDPWLVKVRTQDTTLRAKLLPVAKLLGVSAFETVAPNVAGKLATCDPSKNPIACNVAHKCCVMCLHLKECQYVL
jgi:hypothetical protein